MSVAVVILNWNGKRYLERFLPKVLETSRGVAEVYVADNASTDDSLAFLEQHHPSVKVLINDSNLGFAAGYNEALSQIEARYFVLLNSDIEVTENWIEPVIELMNSDEHIGACQPKILSFNEKNKFEYAGAGGGYIDQFGYPFCRGRIFQWKEEDLGQYDDVQEVFWASGACMFVRADLYHRLGGLDGDFFAHMEEIDFCWRMKHAGHRVMYCGRSTVYHVGGGSLDKSSPRKTYLNIRNNSTMLYKNLPREQLYPVFFSRFFLDMMASFKFLIDGGFRHFVAVARAHLGFYFSYKKNREKRSRITHGYVSHIYRGNIVFDHFLHGVKKFSQLDPQKFSN
ncbi:MAG: glycosyltransferase family 2 protein [Bacteroidales bacterium]